MDAADNGAGSVAVGAPELQGVGAFLRARRQQLGLSHADVANVVKLPARRIDALENERWDELPDGPFLRGFLRNVARALDLNAATLMDRVDASLIRSRNPESILVPPDAPHATLPRRSGPVDDRYSGRKLVFGACALAVVAALIAWSGTDSFERTLATGRALVQPSSTVATGRAPAGTAAQPAAGAGVSAPSPAAGATDGPPAVGATLANATPGSATSTASQVAGAATPPQSTTPQSTIPAQSANSPASIVSLLFHFNEDSWVEVRSADGRVLLQRLNPAGSEQEIDGEAPFSLIVGNARGVALRFRGQPVDLAPYTRDQVARLTLS